MADISDFRLGKDAGLAFPTPSPLNLKIMSNGVVAGRLFDDNGVLRFEGDAAASADAFFEALIERHDLKLRLLESALAPFAKMVKDNGYDGTDHRKLAVTGRTSNRTHRNAYLALQGQYPLIGATTALRKE